MKSKILYTVCVCIIFAYSMQAQSKIGYINSLELLSYMPDIKKADSVLKLLTTDLQKQYDNYLIEYQTKLTDYNNNSATWNPVKKEDTEKDLLGLQDRIGQYQETSQQRLQSKKEELYNPVVAKANDAVQAVGKEQKLTCIIDASAGALIYVGEDMIDIMPIVKQKLNIN
ncbi:MAG: OmpH family outer membrane protein [Fimbriimonadaceae bacterium]|nr:OmpH family outer membrane protein [Chitinophagales bacterium]